jgi:hydrogenase expression/formation protein HypE
MTNKQNEITLNTGHGGRATQRFIKDEILSRFANNSLNELEDGSYVSWSNSQLVLTTDSYIVDPPIFPGGDIGRLAVSGTVNDLVASGAIPKFLSLSLVISEGFPFLKLQQILDSLASTAKESGVEIITGDTKVVEKTCNLGICINTTGIGIPVKHNHRYRLADTQIGDKIIVTGSIGDHALAVLSEREGLGFEQQIQSDCVPLNNLIIPLIQNIEGIHSLRDPTRGGLVGVLHDLAEASHLDVFIDAKSIPIKAVVNFGCEMLGLDPIELVNEGKMVVVVAQEQANDALALLKQNTLGQDAAIIGEIRPSSSYMGNVILLEDNGKKTLLVRTEGQSLPRLC